MEKITITKNISLRKRPKDFEHLDVTVGYTKEIEYEDEEDLKTEVNGLNNYIRRELNKELKTCYKKYWNMEVKIGKANS